MYKQTLNGIENTVSTAIILRLEDSTYIPTDPANTDYQNFKAQINSDEAQLEDVDGNLMSPAAAKAFVATLP